MLNYLQPNDTQEVLTPYTGQLTPIAPVGNNLGNLIWYLVNKMAFIDSVGEIDGLESFQELSVYSQEKYILLTDSIILFRISKYEDHLLLPPFMHCVTMVQW